jgi:hypothetical protein
MLWRLAAGPSSGKTEIERRSSRNRTCKYLEGEASVSPGDRCIIGSGRLSARLLAIDDVFPIRIAMLFSLPVLGLRFLFCVALIEPDLAG